MTTIFFYEEKDPYYQFSNFFKSDILYDGKIWKTSEHLYQAQKFIHDPNYMEMIRNCDTPGKTFAIANQKKTQFSSRWNVNKAIYGELKVNYVIDLAKQHNVIIRSDWDLIKDDIMRYVVYLKFTQSESLKNLLLSTNNMHIVENSPRDSYWGIGSNRDGKNMLGIILMETRYLIFNNLPLIFNT